MNTKDLDERILKTAKHEARLIKQHYPLERHELDEWVGGLSKEDIKAIGIREDQLNILKSDAWLILTAYKKAIESRDVARLFDQYQSNLLTALSVALNGEHKY